MWCSILKFSCDFAGETVRRVEDEHVNLIQNIMERAMRKDTLLGELYLQLIKQTTDHPDPNSRVNLRHWALLSLACSVVLPPQRVIRKYLIAHLKRCSGDCITEEGKYARFAEKVTLKISEFNKIPKLIKYRLVRSKTWVGTLLDTIEQSTNTYRTGSFQIPCSKMFEKQNDDSHINHFLQSLA